MTNKKTILIVDDEQDERTYLSTLLGDNGYNVITAENGDEALKKVKEVAPALITLDVTMPEKSGVKFYREMRESDDWKNIPGAAYLNQIGGSVIQHPYYRRLSTYTILTKLLESYKGEFKDFEELTTYFHIKDFTKFQTEKRKEIIISTKADTLKALRPLIKKSRIEKTIRRFLILTLLGWLMKLA